jgi:SagB-type dehydrogenase family enzyme
MTPPGYLLTLCSGAFLECRGERVLIVKGERKEDLETGSPDVAAALAMLSGGVTEADLTSAAGPAGVAELHYWLHRFRHGGLLWYRVPVGRSFVTVQPRHPEFRFPLFSFNLQDAYVLSRFALLRRAASGLMLESPFASATLFFEDPDDAAVILRYSAPLLIEPASMPLLRLLLRTGFLDVANTPETAAISMWEFQDALFHSYSAVRDSWRPVGGTRRFDGVIPQPAPFTKATGDQAAISRDVISLPLPDAERLQADDPPLARVSEERRSIRSAGRTPIRLEELAEFLWRVARFPRPLPSAGGLDSLEFYVLANRCAGLAAGLYFYSGRDHSLHSVGSAAETIMAAARNSLGSGADTPQIVVILTARFGRMAWTYEGIAYRNLLLDAGVALHAMYLAATAMKLAPCAVGWNDAEIFARAAGLDPIGESSVTLFALSSRVATAAEE